MSPATPPRPDFNIQRDIPRRGSRVRFEKDGEIATFHRPHPGKEAKRYQVRDARDFLERIKVTP